MQNFIDSQTQAGYAFEDDVIVKTVDGRNAFFTATGEPLLNVPTSLVPHTGDLPAPVPTAEDVRRSRDLILTGTDWLVLRHRDEVEGGETTTLTAQQYAEIQGYRQALRDLTKSPDFPAQVAWPSVPSAVAA